MTPKIGITSYDLRCASAVKRAGGHPVTMSDRTWNLLPHDMEQAEEIVHNLDGILIPGGVDIYPDFYEAEQHPRTMPAAGDSANCMRDIFEFTVAAYALDADIPLLGICRGHQMMNIAAGSGATLVQDIGDVLGIRHAGSHRINIVHGTKIAKMVPRRRWTGKSLHAVPVTVKTNSYHHQCVGILGNGVEPTAFCAEGVIEAIELPSNRFAVGVQFHPEFDSMRNTILAKRLFKAFVRAAAK